METQYIVRNNENGTEWEFNKLENALKYQEFLVFKLGIDAEVL